MIIATGSNPGDDIGLDFFDPREGDDTTFRRVHRIASPGLEDAAIEETRSDYGRRQDEEGQAGEDTQGM